MDYVYIRAYGNLTGRLARQTVSMVNLARADGAPQTAIIKDVRGNWHTMNELEPITQEIMERLAYQWK